MIHAYEVKKFLQGITFTLESFARGSLENLLGELIIFTILNRVKLLNTIRDLVSAVVMYQVKSARADFIS